MPGNERLLTPTFMHKARAFAASWKAQEQRIKEATTFLIANWLNASSLAKEANKRLLVTTLL